MPELPSIWLLVLQAVLAVIAVRELGRFVFPAVPRLQHPSLVTDVWAPLAVAAPMLLSAGWVETSVRGTGWLAIGGPVLAGWAALAGVLVTSPRAALRTPLRRDLVAAAGTGLVLLLIGAAQVLTIWVGQCAFAIAAVLLWVNTPAAGDAGSAVADDGAEPARAGIAMLVALAAALGQGLVAWHVEPALRPWSGGLAMGYAAVAMGAASAAGPAAALRTGVWTATLGVLLALGVLAFTTVVPAAIEVLGGSRTPVIAVVADGFGAYAPEAVGLLVLAVSPWLAGGLQPGLRRPVGALVLLAVAVHAAVRLGGLAPPHSMP